jgi:hypothetical protein
MTKYNQLVCFVIVFHLPYKQCSETIRSTKLNEELWASIAHTFQE